MIFFDFIAGCGNCMRIPKTHESTGHPVDVRLAQTEAKRRPCCFAAPNTIAFATFFL